MQKIKNIKTSQSNIKVPKNIITIGNISKYLPAFFTFNLVKKLFSTPVKYRIPEREEFMWKSAQKKTLHIANLKKNVDVLSYGYSDKKVLLVHGWSGRATQMFMPADMLLENRYMIVSFNATAHGKSDGKTSSLIEFIEIIKTINKEFGPFESAIGHSLGGIALYNSQKFLNLKSFVTIGAADTISEIITRFIYNINFSSRLIKKLKNHYDNLFNTDIDDFSSSVQAKNITIPTLVVHDSQDGDVAVSCAYNIRQNLKNGSLLITNGLGHTKILRNKQNMKKVVEFIVNNQ